MVIGAIFGVGLFLIATHGSYVSVDYVSTLTDAAPFCAAMTVEETTSPPGKGVVLDSPAHKMPRYAVLPVCHLTTLVGPRSLYTCGGRKKRPTRG